jgi:Ca-activated chloride channel homolog
VSLLHQFAQVSVMWPRMLWLFVPLAILGAMFFIHGTKRRRAQVVLAGLAPPVSGNSFGGRLRRALPVVLFFVALVALVGAVSRPHANVLLPSLHKDLMIAIDASGSMRATDVKPDRMSAAKQAARTFIENQPSHTRIGIVSIAGTAAVVQSPTDNREDLYQAIDRLQLQRGSALGSGIYIALATLLPDAGINLDQLIHGRSWGWPIPLPGAAAQPVPPGSNRSAAIVVLTDGEGNFGPDPLEAAKFAADHGVRIYTVGIGSREGVPLDYLGWSMRVRLDEDVLRRIAATTHGEYYAATSGQELHRIYEHLSMRMLVERTRTVELTAYLVGMGALLLAISAFFSVLWFNRVL